MGNVYETLKILAANEFKIDSDNIKPDSDIFETFGVDSFQLLNLLSKIEKEFNIEIDYEIAGATTVEDVVNIIEEKLA